MCLSLKCLSYISFLLTMQWEYIVTLTVDNDSIWTIHSILQMDIWRDGTLALQQILINGEPTTFKTIVDENTINEKVDKLSSAMYLTLESNFTNSLMDILEQTAGSAEIPFDKINEIVLKMISILLDLMDLAPNVMSYEPGFLTTLLSLNCTINETINFISTHDVEISEDEVNEYIDRKMWQMINLLERFKIPNSVSDESFENEPQFKTKTTFSHSTSDYFSLIEDVNKTLDNVGPSTIIVSEMQIHDMTQRNHSFNTIIVHVIRQLDFILKIDEKLIENIQHVENDTAVLISYMELILDSVMQIIYQKTAMFLKVIENYQNNNNTERLDRIKNQLIKKNVINTYIQLILKSNLMRFPIYFTNHIRFILEITSEIIFQKEILHIEILITKIDDCLEVLQNKKRRKFKLLQFNNKSKHQLWEILKNILSIQKFKYFNLIIESQQKYAPGEIGSIEMGLNQMKENISSKQACEVIQLMYANVFLIEEKVMTHDPISNSVDNLKKYFENFLSVITSINSFVLSGNANDNLELILPMLNEFLNYNIQNFTFDLIRLKRILYFTINLLDKYQIHSCKFVQFRGTALGIYKRNNVVYNPDIQLDTSNESTAQNNAASSSNTVLYVDSNNYAEEQSLNLLQDSFIASFKTEQPTIQFYWKGELNTFHEIYSDVKNNGIIDFILFRKYIDIFYKWIISVLLYTIVDIFKFLTVNTIVSETNRSFTAFAQNLEYINFPTYVLPVIDTIRKAKNFYQPLPNNIYQNLIEDHVMQYTVIEEKDESYFSNKEFSYFIQHLNTHYIKLLKVFNNVNVDAGDNIDI